MINDRRRLGRMALILLWGLSAVAAPAAFAEEEGGAVLSDKTTTARVDLNNDTVKCSAADYSAPMLKILIPALAELTVLNHRNTREGAPCVAAGPCKMWSGDPNPEALKPEDVLKEGAGTEDIQIRVTLRKRAWADGDRCVVSIRETVRTTIRGIPFFHERDQDIQERHIDDCR